MYVGTCEPLSDHGCVSLGKSKTRLLNKKTDFLFFYSYPINLFSKETGNPFMDLDYESNIGFLQRNAAYNLVISPLVL